MFLEMDEFKHNNRIVHKIRGKLYDSTWWQTKTLTKREIFIRLQNSLVHKTFQEFSSINLCIEHSAWEQAGDSFDFPIPMDDINRD